MELSETTWKWLVLGTIAVVFFVYRWIARSAERRRRSWVDSLATAFGATAEHAPDATSRFYVKVGDRRAEIAQGWRCRTADRRYVRGYRLIIAVPLRNVSDIYNLTFRRRNGQRNVESLTVRNSGYHPRDGWLTAALRDAIFDFYDSASELAPLNLEAGALVYATNRRVDGPALRDLVQHQLNVAKSIERTL